jgi:hypothetical protein
VFEKIEAEVLSEAHDYMNYKTNQVKRKAIRIGEISALVLLGFFLLSFGAAALLATYFPALSGGYSYVILGVVFVVISLMIKV